MSATSLEELIGSTVTIPTVPTTLNEINRILDDPEGSAPEAAEVVAKDQAIATKVLRLANSPLFGLRHPVSNIPHAVSILGLKTLRNLVVQATVLEQFKNCKKDGGFDPLWLWDHSIKVGHCAKTLARRYRKLFRFDPEEAYTAGLLHDVGMIVLIDHDIEKFLQCMEASNRECRSIHLVEEEVFGFHHAQVGSLLARTWKLSSSLSEAIGHHHADSGDEEGFEKGRLIRISDALALRVSPCDPFYQAEPLDENLLSFLDEEEGGVQGLLEELSSVSLDQESP